MKRLSHQMQALKSDKPALKKLVLVLMVLVLVVATLPNLQVGARPAMQATNLAVGKPVTCSATPQFPCAEAVDGNVGTRWASAAGVDPQWLYVDLGSTQSISSIILRWEAAYATAFQIQTSNDATNWTNIYSTTTGTSGVQTLGVSGSGRYVRFYGTVRATQWGYSLWEFEIYGGGAGPTPTRTNTLAASLTPTRTNTLPAITSTFTRTPTATTGAGCSATNFALGKTATASSTENAGTPASSAVDGNAGTRWSSAASDPQWLQIDLGSTQSICRVKLVWEAAYSTSFQVQTSNDAAAWTNIYTTTTGTGGTNDLTVSGSGRYIRVNGTARATIYGHSLWEVEVYTGTNGPTATPTRTNTPVNTPTTGPSLTPSRTFTAVPTNSGGVVMLSYRAPAVASTVQDNANCGGCTADKVTDMSMATRWATEWADPQWIYLDLGATANISRVLLKWEAAFGRSYQIQVSPNASTWTTIYTTTTGDGATDDLTGLSGSGRYIRLYATVRGTGYGYSLFEFQVFGTGGAPQATPTAAPTSTPHGPWVLDWSDEFNGPGIDMNNWVYETGCTGNGNGEWQNYTNGGNSSVQFDSQANSNVLIIEARQTNPTIAACNYSSARMTTFGKREFTYGRIEARLKLPQTKGIWPAFWMMGNNIGTVGWPYNGEIDIMEHIGSLPNTTSGALHGPGYSGGGNIGGELVHSEGVHLNYHIYAVEWAPEQIKWYVDNNNFLTITREQVETKGQWVYDHPFFILLNVAVGGAWPGPPDATSVFPQRMYVDYVRVYK